jgi:hypothetical protein
LPQSLSWYGIELKRRILRIKSSKPRKAKRREGMVRETGYKKAVPFSSMTMRTN